MNATMALLLQDYLCSGDKDLGLFSFNRMHQYDNLMYELVIIDARNPSGQRVTGSATAPTKEGIDDVVKINGLKGEYYTRVIDCQHEFFCIMKEIKDYLDVTRREIDVKTRSRARV